MHGFGEGGLRRHGDGCLGGDSTGGLYIYPALSLFTIHICQFWSLLIPSAGGVQLGSWLFPSCCLIHCASYPYKSLRVRSNDNAMLIYQPEPSYPFVYEETQAIR